MAEVVHRNLESMLPQLEELESSGIFSHDEIKQIVRRRRNHEYKLLRRPPRKEDFLAAVQYEVHLDQLRVHRKKKLGIASTKEDAEFGIQNRIHSLFNRALKKFKGDLKLWLQHIEFSKRCGHKVSLSRTFGRALALHPNNPGLWVMAAKFEFEDMKDVSSARSLLQQGIRTNPHSQHLWIEYFRMELLHTDKVKKRRAVLGLEDGETEEPSSDEFLANKAASLVYKQATINIPDDVGFRLSFLPIYRLFSDTTSLQDEVYRDVQTTFPDHHLVWEALARRHWEGLDTSSLTDVEIEDLENKTEQIFREGISKASSSGDGPTESTTLLYQHWDGYIKWCKERVDDSTLTDNLRKKAVRRLLVAFKESSQGGHLSETKFEEYVEIMFKLELTKEAADISKQATTAHPGSLQLWLQRLKCVSSGSPPQCDLKAIGQLCREALEKIPKQCTLHVWDFWITHTFENEAEESEIESLLKSGAGSDVPAVAESVCGRYLNWACKVGGAKKARKVYKTLLAERHPVPYTLYEQCILLEKKILSNNPQSTNLKPLRELYQRALDDCGSDYPALWLGCIEMEMRVPGGVVENVGRLHWKAVKELRPELTADFIAQYALMQNKTAVGT